MDQSVLMSSIYYYFRVVPLNRLKLMLKIVCMEQLGSGGRFVSDVVKLQMNHFSKYILV